MTVRAASTAGVLLAAVTLAGGCESGPAEEQVGCGILTPRLVQEAVGPTVESRRTENGCVVTDPADRRNHLTIVTGPAVDPESFMRRRCSGGWVFAGTPEKFEPACIVRTARAQVTVMVSEWAGLSVQVALGRNPETIHDDAEKVLDISRDVATHVGNGSP